MCGRLLFLEVECSFVEFEDITLSKAYIIPSTYIFAIIKCEYFLSTLVKRICKYYYNEFWNLFSGKLKWKSLNFSLPNSRTLKILIIHACFLKFLKARILTLHYYYCITSLILQLILLVTKRIYKHIPFAKQQKLKLHQKIKISW